MHYDLNIVWPSPLPTSSSSSVQKKAGKKKGKDHSADVAPEGDADAMSVLSPPQFEQLKNLVLDAAEREFVIRVNNISSEFSQWDTAR